MSAADPGPAAGLLLGGRTAVITGGGRGGGAAIAVALAAAGAAVITASRTEADLAEVTASIRANGGRAEAVICDVTEPSSIRDLAAQAREAYGRVDILINNAGVSMAAPLGRTSLDDWNRIMAVNATGAFLCLQAFLPDMVSAGWGRVVNIASTAGLTGDRYIAAYAASKHALVGLTRAAAIEVADRGVTINAVCPSFLATEMTEQSIARIVSATGRSSDEARAGLVSRNPQKRLIAPREVAGAVVYLCSDVAAGLNGAALTIDGGELRR
jgi:NAD(P)-dependent dehydrogenase (short-subunit alcohol dehydrogenase family)